MALPIIDALIRRPLFLGERPTATPVGYKSQDHSRGAAR
jgi:hypothetical protein